MKQLGPLGVFAIAAVAAAVLPLVGSDYAVSFSIQLLIFLVLAYSWNLIGGYTGYTHFGQVGFFGIGAYVGSLLIFHWNVPWYLAALAAALAGAITALPLGGAMLRLKGPFFAIGMFGLARVLEAFALGFDGITQGGTGIYLKPLGDLKPLYYVVAAVAAVMMLLTWRLDNSRLGLKLLAIREDENAAESLGIPTTRLKIGAFVASAVAPAAMGCAVRGLSRLHRSADRVCVEHRADHHRHGAAGRHGHRARPAAWAPSCFRSSTKCCGRTTRKSISPRSASSFCWPCCSRRAGSSISA